MANRIKEIRTEKGMTLLQLAERLGVSESTVQRYESGNIKNLKYETMVKLAEIFGCSPAYIMGWDPVQNYGQEESYYLDDEARELADLMKNNPDYKTLFETSRKLNKKDLQFVIDMIERFSD